MVVNVNVDDELGTAVRGRRKLPEQIASNSLQVFSSNLYTLHLSPGELHLLVVLPLSSLLLLLEELVEATSVVSERIATATTTVTCHGVIRVLTLVESGFELCGLLVLPGG